MGQITTQVNTSGVPVTPVRPQMPIQQLQQVGPPLQGPGLIEMPKGNMTHLISVLNNFHQLKYPKMQWQSVRIVAKLLVFLGRTYGCI